jgi:hypothetical protein
MGLGVVLIQKLWSDRGGNFGIMTALLAVPLILAAGSAVDISTAIRERTDMQGVADSAALAGAGIYNGGNANAAKAAAKAFLDGYANRLPPGTTYDISLIGQTVHVSLEGSSPNNFMGIVGMPTTPLGVGSAAIAPLKPKTVKFKPTKAQGYWYKKVSILVTRPGSVTEQVVGTVTYQPTTQSDSGQGDMTVSPEGELDLGKYSKLVLQMEVKKDGCPLEYQATVHPNRDVFCQKLGHGQGGYAASTKYDSVLRTDDPQTSHYLFVGGVQLPKNSSSPLDALLECDKTVDHAWEDGGGFERQDFFYTASSECAPDGEFVRLTE